MVKLFGWDGRVKETVAEKREVELKWIFRGAMLALANSVAKYVEHYFCHRIHGLTLVTWFTAV